MEAHRLDEGIDYEAVSHDDFPRDAQRPVSVS